MNISRADKRHLPIVVGLTEDGVEAVGGAVVIPGGSASDGLSVQLPAPTVNVISSRAMSPLKLFPRIPSNTTCSKADTARSNK